MHVRYRRWSGALEPPSVEKELTINTMHIEGRWVIVLLHQGEIGNKLRQLIKYMGLSAPHKTI